MNAIVTVCGNKPKYWYYTLFLAKQLTKCDLPIFVLMLNNECQLPIDWQNKMKQINPRISFIDAEPAANIIGLSNPISGFSRFTFLKLAVPVINELKQYEKILCLDTDIILNEIDSIFRIDMKQKIFGAVLDYAVMSSKYPYFLIRIKEWAQKHNLDYCNNDKYYNCGIVMINNFVIQQNINQYIAVMNNIITLYYKDPCDLYEQGLMNTFFEISELPSKYNKDPRYQTINTDDSILHFMADGKRIFDPIVVKELQKIGI